jgi:transposase
MRGSSLGLGCFAHARRKFFDLHQANNSPMAWEALQRIDKLYAIEAKAKEVASKPVKKCARSKAN